MTTARSVPFLVCCVFTYALVNAGHSYPSSANGGGTPAVRVKSPVAGNSQQQQKQQLHHQQQQPPPGSSGSGGGVVPQAAGTGTAAASGLVPVNSSQQRLWISQAHMQFTLDLLGNILVTEGYNPSTRKLDSFVFSPLSVQSILMMLHLGARGVTKSEISEVLYLSKLDNNVTFSSTHDIFGRAVKSLLEDKQVTKSLASANQIFLQKDLKMAPTFELAISRYHGAQLKLTDFSRDPNLVLQTINDWVSKKTKGIVNDFLSAPPSSLTTIMAVNALHFKSDWQYKFDPQETDPNAWFNMLNGKSVAVPMMVSKLPVAFAHSGTLKATIIELPYKVQRLGLFVILPDETNGLFSLMRGLNSTSFTNLIATMRKINGGSGDGVNIRLPKFEINSTPNIARILRNQLGLRSLFSNGEADLSGMFLGPPGPVHVDDFLHKAILKTDENGSVGAAVSATIVERVGSFNGPYFEADHPFVFFLTDKQTGLILFAGIYGGPKSTQMAPKSDQ